MATDISQEPLIPHPSYSRTDAEMKARIGHLRKKVLDNRDILEILLDVHPTIDDQLELLKALQYQSPTVAVVLRKAIEIFADGVAAKFDNTIIRPLSWSSDKWMLQLDGFGFWTQTAKDTKDWYALLIREDESLMAVLNTGRAAQWPQFGADWNDKRVRQQLNTIPFFDWMGGVKAVYLSLLVKEHDSRAAMVDSYMDALVALAASRQNYRDDDIDPSPQLGLIPYDQRRLFDDCLNRHSDVFALDELLSYYDICEEEPWRQWAEMVCGGADTPKQWLENDFLHNNNDFCVTRLRIWIAQVGLDLFKRMQRHAGLDSVTALRLWLYTFTEYAWAEFLNTAEFKNAAYHYLQSHKVYLRIPKEDIGRNEWPVWAVRAQNSYTHFFVEQGGWSQDMLQRATILPGKRFAVMKR